MKSQLSLDYHISLLVFITFVTYIAFQLLTTLPAYSREIRSEAMRAEVYQLSEILVNDPGEPLNWNENFNLAKRIGFSNHLINRTNSISLEKVNSISTICNLPSFTGYEDIRKKLDLSYDFSIVLVNKENGNILLECRSPVSKTKAFSATIKRIVSLGSSYAELILQVWE